jgi:hypothetical protein
MFERITEAPEGVVALKAVGDVSARDYDDVLKPAVDAAIEKHGKIRLVIEFGPEFDGYSAGAAWEDLKFGAGHLSKFARCAVVTDDGMLGGAVRAFGVLMPGDVKVFPAAERAQALTWAAG